ncbi:hypothetical protein BGZ97_001097 [Linnemannia gamsii]|uniref:Ankyrin n=1 Tax=Linnemannia gamsii TaxID=64522 RepID=A0A9P6R1U3_9FUNG|nr:hypothetical protein BGZ97_001097 [Linnemannia gamsii]
MIEQKSQRLMVACTEGNLELVNRIASKFDSIQELCETEPSSGYTPLMMAARHGHVEVVEALIRLGHDRTETSRDLNNNNILMIAAEHGHLAIFEVYATKFPRVVELSNKKGWTALTTAARFGAIGMVETITLLIEKGSSATTKNNGGWTAQDFAFSDKVSAHMEECWRARGRSMTSSPSSFSSLYSNGSGQQDSISGSPPSTKSGVNTPMPLALSGRKESWTNLAHGPLSPILASISGATSPRLAPSNAWSEFKRVIVKQ